MDSMDIRNFEFMNTKDLHEMRNYMKAEIRRCGLEIESIPQQLRENIRILTRMLQLVDMEIERKKVVTEAPSRAVHQLRTASSQLRSSTLLRLPPLRHLPPTPMPSASQAAPRNPFAQGAGRGRENRAARSQGAKKRKPVWKP